MLVNNGKHEKKTETFFGHGIENWNDSYHLNYLNFGLWENGITEYIDASHNLLTRVGKKAGLNSKSVVLDVACGMGAQDRFFVKEFNCKSIEAIDLTKKHIVVAERNLQNSEYKNRIRYSVGNACNLNFKDNTFTTVTGIEGSINFNTREKFLREAFRVLKPNGKIGLSDYYLVKMPKTIIGKSLLNLCIRNWCIPVENVYGLQVYKRKLEEAGFMDIELEEVGDKAIPGYYFNQKRRAVQKKQVQIRGWYWAKLGLILDYITYKLWQKGIIGYVLVSATKPDHDNLN